MTESSLDAEIDLIVSDEISFDIDIEPISALVEFALRSENATGQWPVAIVLTSDAHLRRLHHQFMGIDEETDVMTFPSSDDDGEDRGGDIVISVERAAVQGPEEGLSQLEEIHFLCVHGVLHLCGWDDQTDADRAAMHSRQGEIIAAFDRVN